VINFGKIEMARTSSSSVEGIIEVDASISLTPFIEAANALVTECCSSVSTYDATRLELIERWLSAHMYTNRDMRSFDEKADEVSEKKQSKVDLGFDTSHYGQMAMRLDTAGGLARLNESTKRGGSNVLDIISLHTDDANMEDKS